MIFFVRYNYTFDEETNEMIETAEVVDSETGSVVEGMTPEDVAAQDAEIDITAGSNSETEVDVNVNTGSDTINVNTEVNTGEGSGNVPGSDINGSDSGHASDITPSMKSKRQFRMETDESGSVIVEEIDETGSVISPTGSSSGDISTVDNEGIASVVDVDEVEEVQSIVEASNEIASDVEIVEQLEEDRAEINHAMQSAHKYGMSPQAMMLINRDLKLSLYTGKALPAHESLSPFSKNEEAAKLVIAALEEAEASTAEKIKIKAAEIWEKIKAFIMKVKEYIKNIYFTAKRVYNSIKDKQSKGYTLTDDQTINYISFSALTQKLIAIQTAVGSFNAGNRALPENSQSDSNMQEILDGTNMKGSQVISILNKEDAKIKEFANMGSNIDSQLNKMMSTLQNYLKNPKETDGMTPAQQQEQITRLSNSYRQLSAKGLQCLRSIDSNLKQKESPSEKKAITA